jgi:uncharacterized protein
MPLFHVLATDKAGNLPLRLANRDAHLAWIRDKGDQVRLAGPLLDEATGDMTGSVLLIDAENREALESLLAEDPYAKAGLFDSVAISAFRWVIGAPPA